MNDQLVALDLDVARRWWASLAPEAPPGMAALWFGLVDLIVDGQPQRHLYIAGSREFDALDPTGDWASPPYVWWPDGRYLRLPALADMPDADTRQLLEHAAAVVTVLAPQTLVDVRGVAVGFDDGDFVITWQRSR